ncbi:hypothetical protein JVU11DRAFT_11000 [Chiua virens]|nr:hypothetical protein JVU11DRAFT_11000 [Chiua virens]
MAQVLGVRSSEVKHHLPQVVTFYAGKLRIRQGGDTFRTKQVTRKSGAPVRKNCYVRYTFIFETRPGNEVTYTGYGDLEKLFVLTLPHNGLFKELSGKHLVLALIMPWNTDGKLASEENVYMTHCRASIVTDVRSLQAAVGLVETRKRWGIIDRTPRTIAANFRDDMNFADDAEIESKHDKLLLE